MAALIRFFSRRFRFWKKEEPTHSYTDDVFSKTKTRKAKKSDLQCKVSYLDGTEQTFYLPKNAKASELYEIALPYVGINEEKDYFGLMYKGKLAIWLDPTKGMKHQCKVKPPYDIALKVKFFSSDPANLHDEYTRYLFTLQLRDEIQSGRLPCTDLRLAVELSALLLQAEFGDCDPKQHTPAFVSTFRFLPEKQQTEEFELAVLHHYQSLSGRNMSPADAESLYLNRVRHLPDYGVEMHTVLAKDKQQYKLGLTPTGILVYEGQKKIGLFFWRNILELDMRGKQLKILVAEEDGASRKVTEHAFCFVLPNNEICKKLWKSAVEYHCFFRLTDHSKPPPKRKQIFRLRSRFQASFRNTEYQLHNTNLFGSSSMRKHRSGPKSAPNTPTLDRRATGPLELSSAKAKSNSFRRVPSQRFNARPSFAKHRQFSDKDKTPIGGRDNAKPSANFVTVANVEIKDTRGTTNSTAKTFNGLSGDGQDSPKLYGRPGAESHVAPEPFTWRQKQQMGSQPSSQRSTPSLPRMGYSQRANRSPMANTPYLDSVV